MPENPIKYRKGLPIFSLRHAQHALTCVSKGFQVFLHTDKESEREGRG